MNADRRLSADFWLHEFSGWQTATPLQLDRLDELVRDVLQPVRNRWGKVTPTSWVRWGSGEPRTGNHATGGSVDFVVPGRDLKDVHRWGTDTLLHEGNIGRWIYEPDRAGARAQREHIHVASLDSMRASTGDTRILSLVEKVALGPDGRESYVVQRDATTWGAPDSPIPLPGFVVTVYRSGWRSWLLLGAVGAAVMHGRRARAAA